VPPDETKHFRTAMGEARRVTRAQRAPAQVSIRLVWPYARLAARYPGALATMSKIGLGPAEYANPDTRLALRDALELLNASIESSGDLALGLHAGELIEPGDFDVLEYAAQSCTTFREAIGCVSRYVRLLSDVAEISVFESGEVAAIRYRLDDATALPPAANDFILSLLVTKAKRDTAIDDLATEIQFAHGPTTYLGEYARVFGTKVTFNAPCNAILLRPERLDAPMRRANPRVSAAFELQVRHLLEKLQENRTVRGRVREIVFAELSRGNLTMEIVARKLGMSIATLRRRLDEEGTRFSEIVEMLREELARQYLREKNHATSEVAFLLGFADVVSFHKAFKRWTGQTPTEFRAAEGRKE
jgi:AraC-like DNA-binding protein